MTTSTTLLLIAHAASTWYLVGLCWLVQRVQYPLMAAVGATHFAAYEQGHVFRIGPVVGPVMVVELLTGGALLFTQAPLVRGPIGFLGFALILVIWASTFFVQVPLHGSLSAGFDETTHAALVRSNWVRTWAWTLRGVLVAVVLSRLLAADAS